MSSKTRPVFLVHGFKDTGRKMRRMERCLRAAGRDAHAVTLHPSRGQLRLEELAAQLAKIVQEKVPAGRMFDLVGFSMGGLICRYLVQRLAEGLRAACLVTIAAPHRGTMTAFACGRPGCRQMRPGSDFLWELNADLAALERLRFLSIWTPLDLMILPSSSSRLPVGAEIVRWVVAHPLMVWQAGVCREVHRFLAAADDAGK